MSWLPAVFITFAIYFGYSHSLIEVNTKLA